ncbi:hypothetical protein OS493_005448, partial [Desmophyllum pertusum]
MMGFGFMFKLDETCIENHLNERRVRTVEDTESVVDAEGEEELSILSDEDGEDDQTSSAVQETANQEDENEEDSLFPDTSIDLQLTKEGKVKLQRGTSRSNTRRDSEEGESAASSEQIKQPASKQRLSAKQRRENRKKAKQVEDDPSQEIHESMENEMEEGREDEQGNKAQQQQQPPKRGKK